MGYCVPRGPKCAMADVERCNQFGGLMVRESDRLYPRKSSCHPT